MGLIQLGGHDKDGSPDVITLTVEKAVNWARKGSLWPMTFGLACCAIEILQSFNARPPRATRWPARRARRPWPATPRPPGLPMMSTVL